MQYQKYYRQSNAEKINETETCGCGGCYIKRSRNRHEKSKQHQQYLISSNQKQPETP